MDQSIFMESNRLLFSKWSKDDLPLANQLWKNIHVSKYICAKGVFSDEEIKERLNLEISNDFKYGIQYWPLYTKEGHFIGCCGLRPHSKYSYEIGVHMLPDYWHKGYAKEALKRVIDYSIDNLSINRIVAGHHPDNHASKKVLLALGFQYDCDKYYAPTGLMHPSYKYDLVV